VKFSGKVGSGPVNELLTFGGDPDTDTDTVPDLGKTCLGRGMHCPSASRCQWIRCSFGQGSSLLWTHMLKPFYDRPIALTQEGRSLVHDVCECVRD